MQSILLTALVFLAGAQQQGASTLAITNVTIVDVVNGATRSNQTVLIDGNRITAVGPTANTRAPRGAQILNGTGKFLIPGLWDMHSHVVGFGRTALTLYVAQGV